MKIVQKHKLSNFLQIGSIFSALLASACCWLPIILVGVGISGLTVSSFLEQYRLLFIVITFVCLAVAFYYTYRPNDKNKCLCEEEISKPILQKFNKVALWGVTALVFVLVFFPNYVGVFAQTTDSEEVSLHKTTVYIKGMTCEACTINVRKAISKIPGVSFVKVIFSGEKAIIGTSTKAIPRDEILNALSDLGYQGSFNEEQTSKISKSENRSSTLISAKDIHAKFLEDFTKEQEHMRFVAILSPS